MNNAILHLCVLDYTTNLVKSFRRFFYYTFFNVWLCRIFIILIFQKLLKQNHTTFNIDRYEYKYIKSNRFYSEK